MRERPFDFARAGPLVQWRGNAGLRNVDLSESGSSKIQTANQAHARSNGTFAPTSRSSYLKLLIRITSLVSLPLASTNCLLSRDQAKSKINPELNLVI
jgi:hypothetical protein